MIGEFISDRLSELSKKTFYYVMRIIRILFSSMMVLAYVISYYKLRLPKVFYSISNSFGQFVIFYNNNTFKFFIIISLVCSFASGTYFTGLPFKMADLPFYFSEHDNNQVIWGGIIGTIRDVVLIIWSMLYGVFSLCIVFFLLGGEDVYIKGKILIACAALHIIACILSARYKSNARIYHSVICESNDLGSGNKEHTKTA